MYEYTLTEIPDDDSGVGHDANKLIATGTGSPRLIAAALRAAADELYPQQDAEPADSPWGEFSRRFDAEEQAQRKGSASL